MSRVYEIQGNKCTVETGMADERLLEIQLITATNSENCNISKNIWNQIAGSCDFYYMQLK